MELGHSPDLHTSSRHPQLLRELDALFCRRERGAVVRLVEDLELFRICSDAVALVRDRQDDVSDQRTCPLALFLDHRLVRLPVILGRELGRRASVRGHSVRRHPRRHRAIDGHGRPASHRRPSRGVESSRGDGRRSHPGIGWAAVERCLLWHLASGVSTILRGVSSRGGRTYVGDGPHVLRGDALLRVHLPLLNAYRRKRP